MRPSSFLFLSVILVVIVLVCKMERIYLTQIDTAFQLNSIFLKSWVQISQEMNLLAIAVFYTVKH